MPAAYIKQGSCLAANLSPYFSPYQTCDLHISISRALWYGEHFEQLRLTIPCKTTPAEQMAEAHLALVQSLADELLVQMKAATPSFFEQVVVDLMLAMGYDGSRKEAGKGTQLTNDGGIDGTLKEDKLDLDVIYLQAKRWNNTVHRPEINKFIGALPRQQARKGVFITTSDFSMGARDAAPGLDIKVVLNDGLELAQLMVEHNLGVSRKTAYASLSK
ncbi:restriction endonuclease [Pseudomonas chlororaphis]|nr:restriction endonuclease [Pseudomonas chlororaphis]WDG75306.1 restriction endonuclease [Pseudomonas chlororaphis]WDH27058.1 restriction endonuclease [Pseudomonas chlororaphis]WDH73826.1 restriction endonuclease [Pseudomonas chlororaphis]